MSPSLSPRFVFTDEILDVENVAEFLSYRGYESDPRSQVILRDDSDPQSPYFPNGCASKAILMRTSATLIRDVLDTISLRLLTGSSRSLGMSA